MSKNVFYFFLYLLRSFRNIFHLNFQKKKKKLFTIFVTHLLTIQALGMLACVNEAQAKLCWKYNTWVQINVSLNVTHFLEFIKPTLLLQHDFHLHFALRVAHFQLPFRTNNNFILPIWKCMCVIICIERMRSFIERTSTLI